MHPLRRSLRVLLVVGLVAAPLGLPFGAVAGGTPGLPEAALAAAPGDANLTLTAPAGPVYAHPHGDPVVLDVEVAYHEPVLDPLGLGLHEMTVDLEVRRMSDAFATVDPHTVTVTSDGAPTTVRLEAQPRPDAPAWEPIPVRVDASGTDGAGRAVTARVTTDVVPQQVCGIRVDGTLPVAVPRADNDSEWRLGGIVHVLNLGNGPVDVTVTPALVGDGGSVTVPDDAPRPAASGETVSFPYTAVLDAGVDATTWSWRVNGHAAASVTPPDGSEPVSCGDDDFVRVGDTRTLGVQGRGTPAVGALAAVAVVVAAGLARRRHGNH